MFKMRWLIHRRFILIGQNLSSNLTLKPLLNLKNIFVICASCA